MSEGKVYLVGAGPGDPGLLTVRGLELLGRADVIVYDQLVNPALLEEASSAAERIFVGKQAGRHCIAQTEINDVLIHHARLGRQVVRLKGGDPFVFGRGGEEAQALADAGITFEVVPGVSSAVAVPAYAGIPLTHRKLASSFAVVTGHEARRWSPTGKPVGRNPEQEPPVKAGARVEGAQDAVDWAKLATAVDTLVILMGLGNLPVIVAKLIAHGRSPHTPVAVIQQGTTSEQETVIGTLMDIVAKSALLEAPALIVVGDVVSLTGKLHWFDPLPYNSAHNEIGVETNPART